MKVMAKPSLVAIFRYERGELSDDEIIDLFASLVSSGLAWSLQGHYGRAALGLIEAGFITKDGIKTGKETE